MNVSLLSHASVKTSYFPSISQVFYFSQSNFLSSTTSPIAMINFHHLVLDHEKQNEFHREIVAHPDKDGYGLETFTLTNTCGTFVCAASNSSSPTIEQVILVSHEQLRDCTIKKGGDDDDGRTTTTTISIPLSNSKSDSSNSFLTITSQDHRNDFIKLEPVTVCVFNCDTKHILQCIEESQKRSSHLSLFVLPFRFASLLLDQSSGVVCALPCAIASIIHQTPSSLNSTIKIIHDCTPSFLHHHSPVFPGDQIPEIISTEMMQCPFHHHSNKKKTEEASASSIENSQNDAKEEDKESEATESSSSLKVVTWKMTEASGCHMDAAKHFNNDNRGIHDYAAQELFAPLVIIDITQNVFRVDPADENPDAGVSIQDILNWEEQNKRKIPDGAFVCMKSGWGRFFNEDPKKYIFGMNSQSESGNDVQNKTEPQQHFPGFELEAAEFLTTHRNVVGLGVDTLSVDKGCNTDFPVHQLVLGTPGSKKYHVENLNLEFDEVDRDDRSNLFIMIAPMRIKDGFEAPCRVLILEM